MKKKISILAGLLLMSGITFAQSGENQIGIGADLAIPTNGGISDNSNIGFGATIKGLYGIGTNGQLELTTGYMAFPGKDNTSDFKSNLAIIPIMAGYRHHLNNFYVEPQVGGALLLSKVKAFGVKASDNSFGFSWAAGVGYIINDFDISARYQMLIKDGSNGFFGIRLGYNFSL